MTAGYTSEKNAYVFVLIFLRFMYENAQRERKGGGGGGGGDVCKVNFDNLT